MSTSIGKISKSFFFKLLVGIIILPFVFWGMGDVFRGGNQNVIATIDSNKVSTQEFVNYINRLNLNETQIESIVSTGNSNFDLPFNSNNSTTVIKPETSFPFL